MWHYKDVFNAHVGLKARPTIMCVLVVWCDWRMLMLVGVGNKACHVFAPTMPSACKLTPWICLLA